MQEQIVEYGLTWSGYNMPTNLEIFSGNITGEGLDEVVAVHPTGSIFIFRYDGKVFRRISAMNLGRRITKAAIGDIDGDNQKELIIASGTIFVVFKWKANRFTRVFVSESMDAEITDLVVGDLTGNFVDDIAIVVGKRRLCLYESRRDGFVLAAEMEYINPVEIDIGNVTGIGNKQLIVLEFLKIAGGDKLVVLVVEEGKFVVVAKSNIQLKAEKLLAVKSIGSAKDNVIICTSNRKRIIIFEYYKASFSVRYTSGFTSRVEDIETADWDKDGRNELFIAVGKQVLVYKPRGKELILVKKIDMDFLLASFAKGDIERDGYIEVVVVSNTGVIVIVKDFFESKSQFLVQQTVYIPKKLPSAIKVAEVKVDKIIVTKKDIITGKIIISGKFLVNILYVAEPDRRVFAIDAEIHFTHFVPVPRLKAGQKIFVDIVVEYVDFRFNSGNPREIEVIIVAQITVYDIVVKGKQTLSTIAKDYNVSSEKLAKVNKVSIDETLKEGDKIKLP